MKTEPGAAGVSYATAIPGTTWEQFRFEFAAPDIAAGARIITNEPWSEGARVGAGFFETLGIPLISGRLFTDAEILGAHHVAIVDEAWVHTILGGQNPLGLMVREPAEAGGAPGPWHEIVGVVGDATIRRRGKAPHDAVLYRPGAPGARLRIRLLIRTQGPASVLQHRLQSAALSVEPDVRLTEVMSMDRLAEAEALPARFFLRVVAVVAAVALLLATAGIFALVSFTLARRTREIGIRIALGAAPRRILIVVFSRAFVQIGLGVLAGALPGFVILGSGVDDAAGLGKAWGAGATAAVCAFVVLVALIACTVPLRRALRIQPTEALRLD
ncbi:MAG TPA: FtsX-like permease family protein [Vicinamibacterales bacterium]|nr:FtsX-like permease family protein [Vicinamibacterales bacterium]